MNRRVEKSNKLTLRWYRPITPLLAMVALGAAGCDDNASPSVPAVLEPEPLAGTEYQPPVLSDDTITTAIESGLINDSSVNYQDIDVVVTQGVVTLTGTADNLLEKDRAQLLAETVRGVRTVVNRVTVELADSPPDDQIGQWIKEALAVDPAADSYEVDVDVNDGKVVLTGAVQSWAESELTERIAKGVKGVREVDNKLRIHVPKARPDREILKDVKSTLRWNALVDDGLIEANVEDGKVILSGVVGSAAEKRQARFSARVAGVTSVDDEKLDVSRWVRDDELRESKYVYKSDEEIEKAIDDALMYDPRVSSFSVDVRVRFGVATLRGVVDNLLAKNAAADDARNTVGIGRVENLLKVRSDVVGDLVIADSVTKALSHDALTNDADVDVRVDNGWVYLDGSIDSYLGRGRAEEIVSGMKGVKVVVNRLVVWDNTIPYTYDPYLGDPNWESYRVTEPYRRTLRMDAEIKLSILDEFFWDPFVNQKDVRVEVTNGVARLSGKVQSWREYEAATKNAFQGGAVWVDNELAVASHPKKG